MKVLLNADKPEFNEYSDAVIEKIWEETVRGPFIINYKPVKGASFSVIGWRGDQSLRLYINKHDRVHYLHLMGESLPQWLTLQTNTRRARQAAKIEREKEEGTEELKEEQNEEPNEETNEEPTEEPMEEPKGEPEEVPEVVPKKETE